jgi:hypothetical protein
VAIEAVEKMEQQTSEVEPRIDLRLQRQGFYSLAEPVDKPQLEQLTFLRLDLGCFWVSGLR